MTPEEDRPLTEEEFFADVPEDPLYRWLELIHKALGHIVALLMLATLLLSFVVFMLGWKL